jgi:hypothetical protein
MHDISPNLCTNNIKTPDNYIAKCI